MNASQLAQIAEALAFICEREDFTFAECSLAEEICSRARAALALVREAQAASTESAQGWDAKWTAMLARRAAVEQLMFDAARGKRPMPTADELRAWALKLGTPEDPQVGAQAAEAPVTLGGGKPGDPSGEAAASVQGMVCAVACDDKREVLALFDTPAQAHAFVRFLRRFMSAPDAAPTDGGRQG